MTASIPLSQLLAQVVGVIAPVGEQATERVGCLDQRLGHADVVDVAGAEHSTCRLPREGLSLGRSSLFLRQQPSGAP